MGEGEVNRETCKCCKTKWISKRHGEDETQARHDKRAQSQEIDQAECDGLSILMTK